MLVEVAASGDGGSPCTDRYVCYLPNISSPVVLVVPLRSAYRGIQIQPVLLAGLQLLFRQLTDLRCATHTIATRER